MIEVPVQLCKPDIRFCLVRKPGEHYTNKDGIEKIATGKEPRGYKWDEERGSNFSFDDKLFIENLEQGANYGVVCGFGGIVVVDADAPIIEEAVRNSLPETFTVQSGGATEGDKGRKHFYYKVNEPVETITLDDHGKNIGHVKSWGGQVIGPNSLHQSGKTYKVINDIPITEITAQQIKDTFAFYLLPKWVELEKKIKSTSTGPDQVDSLQIQNLMPIEGFTQSTGYEWQGSHPVHGSTTGQNFCFNTQKNLWHCFRHSTGGNAISWLAVKAGILNCEDARPGVLRGDKFKETVAIAQQEGYMKKHEGQVTKTEVVVPSNQFSVMSYSELKGLSDKDQDWLIPGLIPQGSLIVIAGKGGSYKSMFALEIAASMVTGSKCLGLKEPVRDKPGVLFVDEENPIMTVKKRIKWLGLDLEKDYPLFFLNMKGTNIGQDKWLKPIDAFLEAHKEIGLVVVDSLTRASAGIDENEAGAINELLQPIKVRTAQTGITWLFLHHSRKTQNNKNGTEEEAIDRIRGSSDIVNVADVAMLFQKYKQGAGDGFTVDFAKMRMYELPERMSVDAVWGETDTGEKTLALTYISNKEVEDNLIAKAVSSLIKLFADKPQFSRKTALSQLEETDTKKGEGFYPKRTIDRALKTLVDSSRATKPEKGVYQISPLQKVLSND